MGPAELLLAIGISSCAFVVTALGALLVPRIVPPDAPVPRRSAAVRVLSMVPVFVVPATFAVFDLGTPILAAVAPGGTPSAFVGADVIGNVLLGLTATIPTLTIGALSYQLHAAMTNPEVPGRQFLRRWIQAIGVTGGTVAAGWLGFLAVLTVPHPIVFLAIPVVFGFAYKLVIPLLFERANPVREPTAAEREVVEAAASITDTDPEHVLVLEDQEDVDAWRPFARGIGPTASVYVPEWAFEELEPEVLETILVHITTGSRHGEFRTLVKGLIFGCLLVAAFPLGLVEFFLGGPIPVFGIFTLVVIVFGLTAIGYLAGKRIVFRHDDRVAELLGPERVVTALVRQDELRGEETVDPVTRYSAMIPSNGERIWRQRAKVPT